MTTEAEATERGPALGRPGQVCLFTGGCYRSGTTLLEKLLNHHPDVSIASQPFPDFYFYCKGVFDRSVGGRRRYPLDHLFLEDDYTAADLHAFLDEHWWGDEDLDAVFELFEENALGLWTPEMRDVRSLVKPGYFWDLYGSLLRLANQVHGGGGCRYLGSKEVLCEEYVPWLLKQGGRAILVVRDPRDMISSLNFSRRDNMTGADRPVLFSLRIWRKSVAVCLAMENDPGFMWLRYEDLARDPSAWLARITEFLGLGEIDPEAFAEGIRHQDGSIWQGNSSFSDRSGVSTRSLGRFEENLPGDVLAFVEACCRPEMLGLGYEPIVSDSFDEGAIRAYVDPFESIHSSFPADYSCSPDHRDEEVNRCRFLESNTRLSISDRRRWFLFDRAYRRLADRVADS